MRYTLQIDIDRPRDAVVALFDDPANLSQWQPGFIRMEPIDGEPGQPGARTRLVYRHGKGEMEMVETITERELPERFSGTYENDMAYNTMVNRFEALDTNRTRWTSEIEFTARTWPMRLMMWFMPGAFRKQSWKFMEQFRIFAEREIG